MGNLKFIWMVHNVKWIWQFGKWSQQLGNVELATLLENELAMLTPQFCKLELANMNNEFGQCGTFAKFEQANKKSEFGKIVEQGNNNVDITIWQNELGKNT